MKKYNTTLEIQETTQNTKLYDRTTESNWIIPIVIVSFLTFVTLWLLFSLIHYGIKTKKWRRTQSNEHVLNSGLIYSCAIACAFACIVRYSMSLGLMNVGFKENESGLCDSFFDAVSLTYFLVLFFVAMFLWFRQRAFYAHELLNVHYNNVIKFLSLASIICIVGYGIIITVLITFPNTNVASRTGCMQLNSNDESQMLNWLAPAIGVILYKPALVGLFSYALTHIKTFEKTQTDSKHQEITTRRTRCEYSQQISNYSVCATTKSVSRKKMLSKSSTANKIKLTLKRSLVVTIVSALADIFLQTIPVTLLNPIDHGRFVLVLYDISSFVNLLFVIFSFGSYKDILMSTCKGVRLR